MTDQIPADAVRAILANRGMRASDMIAEIEALLPPPPPTSRPTLADMTDDERAACKWMQADVADHDTRYVIANPDDGDGEVALIAADGRIEWIFPEYVTPRPDLPRLEWPGDQKPVPAPALPDGWRLADHQKYGRVIVTNPTPNRHGYAYFVAPATGAIGNDWHSCDPDDLTYIDSPTSKEADTPTGQGHLAVGAVIESADDPRIDALPAGSILLDRDEEATMKRPWEWEGEGYIPIPSDGAEFGPWTVLHIPKEADQ